MSEGMNVPDGLYYSKDHEWVKIEDNMAIVGITDHAQQSLHEITYVELNEVGATIKAGEECGLVESMKASSDILSPLSGEIIEVNTNLEDAPEIVNDDPYGKGWMFKIRPSNLNDDLKNLMDAKAYENFIKQQS